MNSKSDIMNQHDTFDTIFPKEILSFFYKNDEDTIFIVWNEDNELIYLSKNIETFTEFHVNDLIGDKWTHLLMEEHVEKVKKHLAVSNERLHISNISLRKHDDTYTFNGDIDSVVIGNEKQFLCKLTNVTHLNELRKILLDSEKLILAGQLSAGLVHEIRNPLTSLKGFLQLVQAGVEQKEEYYKVMIGEIDKLEKITSELLQMAKPFKNNRKYEDVHEMINDVMFIMGTQMNMREVEFIVNVEENLACYCNASQIKQVLINLMKNAAEAMDNKGKVIVNVRKEGTDIAIDIIDKGQGMSDEVVRELSNPFFTTKSEGTGLGLVITHHILEMHNGRLRVQSNEENGSTFTILLPNDSI